MVKKSLGVRFAVASAFPACVGVNHRKMRMGMRRPV